MKQEAVPPIRTITLADINAGRLEAAASGTFVEQGEYPDYAGHANAERSEAILNDGAGSEHTTEKADFTELNLAYRGYLRAMRYTPSDPASTAVHHKK
jgi:hypothetical protein